jgi:hypothetical protein
MNNFDIKEFHGVIFSQEYDPTKFYKASKTYNPGDEVKIVRHIGNNLILLQTYGTVEISNPNEYLPLAFIRSPGMNCLELEMTASDFIDYTEHKDKCNFRVLAGVPNTRVLNFVGASHPD